MNKYSRLLINTGATIVSKATPPILSMILIITIARFLGVEELGKFTFLITLFTVFQVISSLSFNYLLTKEAAKDRAKTEELYSSSLYIGFFLSGFCLLAGGFAVSLLGYSEEMVKANWIIAFGLLPSFWITINDAVFMVHEKNKFISYITLFENIFKVSLCLILLGLGYKVVAFALVITASRIIAAILGFRVIVQRFFRPTFRFKLSICKKLVTQVPSFALIYSLGIIFLSTDILMLSYTKSHFEVGIYGAAMKIINFFKIVPESGLIVLYPLMSSTFHNKSKEFYFILNKAFKYIVILVLPLAFLTAYYSNEILYILYDEKYKEGAVTLSLLSLVLVTSALHSFMGNTLMVTDHQNKVVSFMTLTTIVNIVLNFIFIPLFSYNGAAFATLLSSTFLLFLCMHFVSKYLGKIDFASDILRPLSALSLSGLFIIAIQPDLFFVTLLLFMTAYFFFLTLLKGLTKDDYDLFSKVLTSSKSGSKESK